MERPGIVFVPKLQKHVDFAVLSDANSPQVAPDPDFEGLIQSRFHDTVEHDAAPARSRWGFVDDFDPEVIIVLDGGVVGYFFNFLVKAIEVWFVVQSGGEVKLSSVSGLNSDIFSCEGLVLTVILFAHEEGIEL